MTTQHRAWLCVSVVEEEETTPCMAVCVCGGGGRDNTVLGCVCL